MSYSAKFRGLFRSVVCWHGCSGCFLVFFFLIGVGFHLENVFSSFLRLFFGGWVVGVNTIFFMIGDWLSLSVVFLFCIFRWFLALHINIVHDYASISLWRMTWLENRFIFFLSGGAVAYFSSCVVNYCFGTIEGRELVCRTAYEYVYENEQLLLEWVW